MEQVRQENFCNYCLSMTKGHRYRCLECYRYDLCCSCFRKGKWNERHEQSHVIARLCQEQGRLFFGKRFEEDQLKLDHVSRVFAGETHTNHECKICHCTPIVGLRLKCDYCFDFNVCFECRKKHRRDHPLMVYGKTVPMEILMPTDVEILDASTARCHDQVCSVTRIKTRDSSVKIIIREQEAYSEINGANLLKMVGYFFDTDLVVLMPLVEKGNLRDLLKKEPELQPWRRLFIAADVASGLTQIHNLNRVHRDIKAENVYIDGEYRAKIACDPLAIIKRDFKEENFNWKRERSLVENAAYDQKRDNLHLGLLLNQLFGGDHFYDVKLRQYRVNKCDAMFWDLISPCLDPEPERRPSVRHISEKLVALVESIGSETEDAFDDQLKVAVARYEAGVGRAPSVIDKTFEAKLKYYNKKLGELEKIYPSQEDPECINTLLSIGDCELEAKKLDGAFEFYNKALDVAIRLHNYGDHLDVVDSLLAFGRTYLAKGEPTDALRYYQEALSILKRVLGFGQSHPILAETLSCIGRCQVQLNDHYLARESFMNALDMKRIIYGSESSMLLATLEGLKDCCATLGDVDQERQYEEEYFRVKKQSSDALRDDSQLDILVIPDSPMWAPEKNFSRLGLSPSCPDTDDPVLRYLFAELMSSHELFAFNDNTYTIKWLRELAFYFYIREDAPNSELYAERCLKMCHDLFGPTDSNMYTSDALLSMSRVSELRGDLQSAIEYGQKCLKMRSELRILENHPRLTVVMETIGDYYQKMDDERKAIEYFLQVLERQKRYHGAQNSILVHILTKLGDAYEHLNDKANSARYRKEASQLL